MELELEGEIERIRQIYCEDVLRKPNREVGLLGRKCDPRLMTTFLGYELKLGRKRIGCPDLASAHYLMVFAEIGMETVRIPYDPTRTSILQEGLRHALNRIKETVALQTPDAKRRARRLRSVYTKIRQACLCPPTP